MGVFLETNVFSKLPSRRVFVFHPHLISAIFQSQVFSNHTMPSPKSPQVRQQLRKTGTGAEWTGSVLARAEQERRLALLAREAVAHLVRDGDVTAVAAEGVAPSSGLPTLKVAGTIGFFQGKVMVGWPVLGCQFCRMVQLSRGND